MGQAYDYWQDQPGSLHAPERAHPSNGGYTQGTALGRASAPPASLAASGPSIRPLSPHNPHGRCCASEDARRRRSAPGALAGSPCRPHSRLTGLHRPSRARTAARAHTAGSSGPRHNTMRTACNCNPKVYRVSAGQSQVRSAARNGDIAGRAPSPREHSASRWRSLLGGSARLAASWERSEQAARHGARARSASPAHGVRIHHHGGPSAHGTRSPRRRLGRTVGDDHPARPDLRGQPRTHATASGDCCPPSLRTGVQLLPLARPGAAVSRLDWQ